MLNQDAAKFDAERVFGCHANLIMCQAKETSKLGMVESVLTPTASHLKKIGKVQSAGCWL